LLPIPNDLFTAVVFFENDEATLDAVDEWRPVPGLRMLEYVDRDALSLVRPRFPDLPERARGALLIEAEGVVDIEAWEQRLRAAGAMVDESWFAVSAADRERFRKFRHTLPEMVNATVLSRGFMKMGTDYAVPVERNREMLTYYRQRLNSELPGKSVIYGHIGDAHLHVQMLPANREEAQTSSRLLTDFAAHAVSLGGTVSAEHGSPEAIENMKAVKRCLDPKWLLGRDTLFPLRH
jgi:FAD/FMN-containing dehydrogenase